MDETIAERVRKKIAILRVRQDEPARRARELADRCRKIGEAASTQPHEDRS